MNKQIFQRTPRHLALVLIAGASAGLPAAAVHAQEAQEAQGTPTAQAAIDTAELDTFVIIGSNRRDVTALQSVSPVQVFSSQTLTRTGAATLTQALQKLVPSFNFPQARASNVGIITASSASLRGMSPDHTLVLINGKRRHRGTQVQTPELWGQGSQPVDINTIPVALVERVEVLTDGASAQYGSDAIAGVINIVLKEKATGGQLTAQVGQYAAGDGFQHQLSGWKGFQLGEDGFATVSLTHLKGERVDRVDRDERPQYLPQQADREPDNGRRWHWGTPATDSLVLGYNGEVALQPHTRLYSFATYNRRESDAGSLPVRALQDTNLRAIYPDGFQPTKEVELEDYAFAAGVRHQAAGGEFDFGLTTGKAVNRDSTRNSLNPSLGLDSPTRFDQGRRETSQHGAELNYRSSFATGYAADPISFNAGLGVRRETWSQDAGDDASWRNGGALIPDGPNAGQPAAAGEPSGAGYRPEDDASASRSVRSLFAAVEQNVTDRLRLGAAVRGEHYSDFGSSLTGKLSARFQATPALALRGTLSSGFRAPTLGQSNLQVTSITFDRDTVTRFIIARPESAIAQVFGASKLKAEKSDNLSLGLVYQPSNDTSLTVDAYQIRLDDGIVLSGFLAGGAVEAQLAAAGYDDVKRIRFFTNALKSRTHGIDVTGRHRLSLGGAGTLDLTAGYSYHRTRILDVKQPGAVAAAGLDVLNRVARGLITSVNPEHKASLSANYSHGPWHLTLTERYHGKYQVLNVNPALDQTFAARWLTDLEAGYRFNAGLSLAVGVNNLFDTRGEKVIAANRSATIAYASVNDPEGPNGAFYYARLNYAF